MLNFRAENVVSQMFGVVSGSFMVVLSSFMVVLGRLCRFRLFSVNLISAISVPFSQNHLVVQPFNRKYSRYAMAARKTNGKVRTSESVYRKV